MGTIGLKPSTPSMSTRPSSNAHPSPSPTCGDPTPNLSGCELRAAGLAIDSENNMIVTGWSHNGENYYTIGEEATVANSSSPGSGNDFSPFLLFFLIKAALRPETSACSFAGPRPSTKITDNKIFTLSLSMCSYRTEMRTRSSTGYC